MVARYAMIARRTNICVGPQLVGLCTAAELQQHHSGVVLAHGALLWGNFKTEMLFVAKCRTLSMGCRKDVVTIRKVSQSGRKVPHILLYNETGCSNFGPSHSSP